VRYWAASGLLMRKMAEPLRGSLSDASPYVRIVAAEALGRFGNAEDLKNALAALLEVVPADRNGAYVSIAALNALDALGEKAATAREAILKMPLVDPAAPERARDYGVRLAKEIAAR
jgi:HEAT repeat protein